MVNQAQISDKNARHRGRRVMRVLLCAGFLYAALPNAVPLRAQAISIPEEIEWTWEVRPPHPDPRLPNVLLLGDSITRNYFPQVTKDLAGVANVYLMAASTCVGDPRFPGQISEFAALEHVQFRVVHFNNGMHGWDYSEAQYKQAFPEYLLDLGHTFGTGATLIWATTTPVRADATGGATNPRVVARNVIADDLVSAQGIAIDDQHQLMMEHQDLHEDPVHFNPAGAAIQGDQAASYIRTALENRGQRE
jgi:hypothetical protein